jgi:hypothetical protein
VAAGSSSTQLLGEDFHFDHTSILKTILTRFCAKDGQIPELSARVAAAEHLGHLLGDPSAPRRGAVADHSAVSERMVRWREGWAQARYADPVAAGGPPGRLNDLQLGFYEMARLLRHAGLPAGHP